MKLLMSIVTITMMTLASYASAAEKTPQQNKMTQCNQQASANNLKGEPRKSFMSDCLKKDKPKENLTPQQAKMKTCNSEAKTKNVTGDARKQFMSNCLKK